MSGPQFTPGPWLIEPQGGARGHWFQRESDGGYIAMSCRLDDRAEEDANARLIAAAPDYDAFAASALPLLEVLHSTCQSADTRKTVWSCILAGRAALAKARGDQ